MPAEPPHRSRAERSTGVLALFSWVVLLTALLPGLTADPLGFTPWHWLVFASALPGLAGGALWLAGHPRWRIVSLFAACSYLAVAAGRFLLESVWWQLDFVPVLDALRFAFWMKGRQVAQPFSHGRILEGLGFTFYEALMPAFQLIVLFGLALTRRR